MIVENIPILTKWSKTNKKHYLNLGYKFTGIGDNLYVNVEDWRPMKEDRLHYKCDYCGGIFETNYGAFKKAHKTIDKDCCTHCVGKKCAEITLNKRREKLYRQLLEKCEESGYKLITNKNEIENNRTYITYICPKHGEQSMRIGNFLFGKKCPKCLTDNNRELFQLSQQDVIDGISKCGGHVLNPEEYKNSVEKNLRIICPKCGNEFLTSFRNFVQHGGQLCRKCSSQGESHGEMLVRTYLEDNGIQFLQEHWFDDCRDINPLPFDFYLPNYNTIIEFDGRQHYEGSSYMFFKHSVDKTHEHDQIKNKYCEKHNINLIRIPYWHKNNIDEILNNELQTHKDIV